MFFSQNSFRMRCIKVQNPFFHSKTLPFQSLDHLFRTNGPTFSEDHLWILRGTDADLERLLLVLSLGPQYVKGFSGGQRPGWDVKIFGRGEKEESRPWVNLWMFQFFFSEIVVSFGYFSSFCLRHLKLWDVFWQTMKAPLHTKYATTLFAEKNTLFRIVSNQSALPGSLSQPPFPQRKAHPNYAFPNHFGSLNGADLASENDQGKDLECPRGNGDVSISLATNGTLWSTFGVL